MLDSDDEVAVWAALVRALSSVFRTAEKVRVGYPDYYSARDADPYGAALGGLVYFRGETEHAHAEELYVPGYAVAEVWVARDGKYVRGQVFAGQGGEWVPAIPYTPARVFPPLHPTARPDAHGRDTHYRTLVAGQPVAQVFIEAEAALRRLADMRKTYDSRLQNDQERRLA
ncbi:hypothetical protein CXR34_13465 [Microbacterium hominis]|uniref:Uncharacterized protein n=1 Tax=Microbacterium hominis TaxID=162426 RepID=A0A2K9DSV1_9MICO|nr:hypothetical protein CXR34_13465 [Microbacterium hominis]